MENETDQGHNARPDDGGVGSDYHPLEEAADHFTAELQGIVDAAKGDGLSDDGLQTLTERVLEERLDGVDYGHDSLGSTAGVQCDAAGSVTGP